MIRRIAIIPLTCLALVVWAPYSWATEALDLISTSEAALPDVFDDYMEAGAFGDDGPVLELISPLPGKSYAQPMPINVKFLSKDNREIDVASLKVEYVKSKPVDITNRLISYMTADGIMADKLNLPPGLHRFRVSVSDVEGRRSSMQFIVSTKW